LSACLCCFFFVCVFSFPFFFFCGRVTDYQTCRSESRLNKDTRSGRSLCSRERPDQTRRTPINPKNRTAPQIKMHPGHSICVPLPSSQCTFTASHDLCRILKTTSSIFLWQSTKCRPLYVQFGLILRGWREEGAPTRTYPDQREQSWASIYTCLPLGPQSYGSGGHFTQEKQIVEKSINKKKGKGPNPLLSFTTAVSQTFFIIMRFIVYIFSIKSMRNFFFFLNSSFLFSIKRLN